MKYISLKKYSDDEFDKLIKMLDIVGVDYDVRDDERGKQTPQLILTLEDEIKFLESAVFESMSELNAWMVHYGWVPIHAYSRARYMKETYTETYTVSARLSSVDNNSISVEFI